MQDRLWYRAPASVYMDGLPIGDGRLAAMVLGGAAHERIALNHEWLWLGKNRDRDLEDVSAHLPEVRQLLLDGKWLEGTAEANRWLGGKGGISKQPHRVDPYVPVGDLYIDMEAGDAKAGDAKAGDAKAGDAKAGDAKAGGAGNYTRELSLVTGLCRVSFDAPCGRVVRETYVHAQDSCLVMRITAEKPTTIALSLSRADDPRAKMRFGVYEDALVLDGTYEGGTSFAAEAHIVYDCDAHIEEDRLVLTGATSVTVLLNAGTDVKGVPPRAEMNFPDAAEDWEERFARHTRVFEQLMRSAQVFIDGEESQLPTDERIAAFKRGEDALLPLLYFNYGKYLLASGSSGELPLNLQGKWNEDMTPPWECDYHLDINLQMCYWFAERLGFSRQALTMVNLVEGFLPHGREAARKLYGCRGAYFSITTDAWGRMTPEACGWAVWTGAAAWLAQHAWRHWEYSRDEAYLRERCYPFLKDVALFYADYLIERDDGTLCFVPSQSPENRYTGAGETWPVSLGRDSAMDIELCAEAVSNAVRAAELLGVDGELCAQWKRLLQKLPPLRVGAQGQLLEWDSEYRELEPGHRHLSHLYALYPGDRFAPGEALTAAAERSLDIRLSHGGGHTGWSRSWVACLMARLGRAEEAWHHMTALICDFATISLLDLHPPRIFQIDGNMGGTAAICEMLLRDCYGCIELLPALPSAWPSGSVRGMKLVGGMEIDFAFDKGAVTSLALRAPLGAQARVRCAKPAQLPEGASWADGILSATLAPAASLTCTF